MVISVTRIVLFTVTGAGISVVIVVSVVVIVVCCVVVTGSKVRVVTMVLF